MKIQEKLILVDLVGGLVPKGPRLSSQTHWSLEHLREPSGPEWVTDMACKLVLGSPVEKDRKG